MLSHDPVDVPAQDLLPALRAVRLPYGLPVKRLNKERPRAPRTLTERDRSE